MGEEEEEAGWAQKLQAKVENLVFTFTPQIRRFLHV